MVVQQSEEGLAKAKVLRPRALPTPTLLLTVCTTRQHPPLRVELWFSLDSAHSMMTSAPI